MRLPACSSVLLLTLLGSAASAAADTITIAPILDSTLYQDPAGNLANGKGTRAFFGANASGNIRRYLVQFDIAAALPAGSTIQSATLEINPLGIAPGSPGNLLRDVHRVTQAWGEGNSNAGTPGGHGAASQSGDATWLHTFYSTSFWTTPGGDFVATKSGTFNINSYGRKQLSSTVMASDVQDWLNNPATNFGWVLKDQLEGNSSAVAISSREDTFPNSAPTLTIVFTPPGTNPSTFCDPALNNSTGFPTVLAGTLGSPIGAGLHLEASSGPPTQFGYILVGTDILDPGTPLGSGLLCLSSAGSSMIGRYNISGSPLSSVGIFDGSGVLQNVVGTSTTGFGYDVPTTLPLPGNPTVTAGSTWHFQLWHRENGGNSNFSNGLSVTF